MQGLSASRWRLGKDIIKEGEMGPKTQPWDTVLKDK